MQDLPQPLLHINWNLSNACALDCAHCYSRDRVDEDELTLPEKLAVADNIIASGVFDVNMGGGEPLDCPDLYEVAGRLTGEGVSVSICTSGWHCESEDAYRLRYAGINRVFVSLDGATPEVHDSIRRPGSFERAIEAMQVYIAAGLDVYVSSTVMKPNFSQMADIVAVAEVYGALGLEFKRVKRQGNAYDRGDLELDIEEEMELFREFPGLRDEATVPISLIYGFEGVPGVDDGCPCGKSVLAIMSDGTVSPCVYSRHPLGNATVDRIDDIWFNSPELARFRNTGTCPGLGFHLE